MKYAMCKKESACNCLISSIFGCFRWFHKLLDCFGQKKTVVDSIKCVQIDSIFLSSFAKLS